VTHDNVAGYVVAALFPPFVLFFVWALVAAIMFVSRRAYGRHHRDRVGRIGIRTVVRRAALLIPC
jgi:hypothetical protein